MKDTHIWKNKKNGKKYIIICDNVINANNRSKHKRMVCYKQFTKYLTEQNYVRDYDEFLKKFDPSTKDDKCPYCSGELEIKNEYKFCIEPGTCVYSKEIEE